MTEVQYRRWKSLSLRMAHRGLGLRQRRSRERVAEMVKYFFRIELEDNHEHLRTPIGTFEDPPFDEGLLSRIASWDGTEAHPTWRDVYGHGTVGPFVCDLVSRMEEDFNPHYWGWESDCERWSDLWMGRLRCCLRVGIDMASEQSAGVLGFTAGDVRRMYRGKVPKWMFGDEKLTVQTFKGVVPGVGFVPGPSHENGTFAELQDEQQVWL